MTISDVTILNLSIGIISIVARKKLLNRLKKRKRNEEKHKQQSINTSRIRKNGINKRGTDKAKINIKKLQKNMNAAHPSF